MTERALRLVDDNGEVVEAPDMAELRQEIDLLHEQLAAKDKLKEALEQKLVAQLTTITKLRNDLEDAAPKDKREPEIRAVLLHHRSRFHTMRKQIIPESDDWKKVRDRLNDRDINDEPVFTADMLCEAVDGCELSDWHCREGFTTAESIFREPSRVQKHIARYRQAMAQASSEIRDMPPGLREHQLLWLSEDCSCTHARVKHWAARENCTELGCGCKGFSGPYGSVERFLKVPDDGKSEAA